MKKAILFYSQNDFYDVSVQREAVNSWLEKNEISDPVEVIEDANKVTQFIYKFTKENNSEIFICHEIMNIGLDAKSIIRNFVALEEAGINVIVVSHEGLNYLMGDCPVQKDKFELVRKTVMYVLTCLHELEKKNHAQKTLRGIEYSKAKNGKAIGRPSKVNDENKSRCKELRDQGKTLREIADKTELSINTVRENLKEEI